jgi:chemotaxis protein MotB
MIGKVTMGVALAASMLATGCVKKSSYETLQARHQEVLRELDDTYRTLQEQKDAAEKQLALEKQRKEESDREIADLKAQLEASRQRQLELQGELTKMVHDSSKLKSSVDDMQRALAALEAQRRETQARIDEYKRLLGSFKKLIDAGKLRVKVVGGRMVIELPSDILFASGSVDVSTDGRSALTEVGSIFSAMRDKRFQVEGHTDDQPIRTSRFPNNWALAAGRAIAVTEVLMRAGVAPENLSAASFGEYRPVASNKAEGGRKQNRRIEIVLVPDLSKVPGFDELEKAARQ